LEGVQYACGATDYPTCGVGAPHKRQRLYWCALADTERRATERHGHEVGGAQGQNQGRKEERQRVWDDSGDGLDASGVANTLPGRQQDGSEGGVASDDSSTGSVDDATQMRHGGRASNKNKQVGDSREIQQVNGAGVGHKPPGRGNPDTPGPTNGHWRDADWLWCRDEKWRAVEPGTFPLVDGATARVGRLRGYGNAIVAPQAQAFVEAFMEISLDNHPVSCNTSGFELHG